MRHISRCCPHAALLLHIRRLPPGTHANLVELPPKRGHAPPTTDGIPVADRLAFATRASLWSPSTPLLRSEAIEAP